MDRAGGFSPWLLVVTGMLGVSAGSALVTRGTASSGPASAPGAPAKAAAASSASIAGKAEAALPPGPGAGWIRGALPALRVVADFLGVPAGGWDARLADRGLTATPARNGSARGGTRAARAAIAVLRDTEKALASRPLADVRDEAERAVRALAALQPPKDTELDRFRKQLLEQAQADAESAWLLCTLKERAIARKVATRFVIATLPDYVDSSSAWNFDLNIDAIQRAAAAMGYVSDRFYLPDWHPETRSAAGAGPRRAHEHQPGLILFRRLRDNVLELLMVLIVPETPTTGIHTEALLSAVSLVTAWAPDERVLILGPTFSGSTLSLQVSLEEAFNAGIVLRRSMPDASARVRIVSGSATSPRNKERLEVRAVGDNCAGGGSCRLVEFHATAASDNAHLAALQDYLGSIHPPWAEGGEMALLYESNTIWGNSLSKQFFPKARVFPFPLHISRLRAEAAGVGRSRVRVLETSAASVSLKLDEAPGATDHLPSLTPELTSAMAETALANILDGIKRLDVTTIGIYATDKRDHLFLAQEISRRAPNVLLFALEGNLAYLHADYRSYVRGALVVGSYPLLFLTQRAAEKSNPAPQHQFPAMGAQGMYNALLALLDQAQLLLDYGSCDGTEGPARCGPSVWVGVVGHEEIWPLRRDTPLRDPSYYWRPDFRRLTAPPAAERAPAPGGLQYALPFQLVSGFLVVAVVTLGVAGGAWLFAHLAGGKMLLRVPCAETSQALPAPRSPERGAFQQEYWLSILSCAAPLACVGLSVATAWFAGRPPGESVRAVFEWTRDLFLAGLAVAVLAVMWRGWRALCWRLLVLRGLVVLLGLATLMGFRETIASPLWAGNLSSINALRFADVGSLVSPASPVLCFSLALLAWGMWNMWRVNVQAISFHEGSPLLALLGGDNPIVGKKAVGELKSPSLGVSGLGLAFVAAVLLAQAGLGLEFRHAADGSGMGWFLWAGTLFLTGLMGHTLAHCVQLGRRLLDTLRALDLHPLGPAFSRVANPLAWRMSLSTPAADALTPLVRQACALARAIREEETRVHARVRERVLKPWYGRVDVERRNGNGHCISAAATESRLVGMELQIRAEDVGAIGDAWRVDPDRFKEEIQSGAAFHATQVWQQLEHVSAPLIRALERGCWARRPYPAEGQDAARPCHREAESLLALQIAVIVKHFLARLLYGLTVALAGLVLILCAHLFYSFQGRQFWLAFDWVCIGLGTAVAVWLLVSLEKDAVLSRLWGTRPGRIDWSGGLVYRIAVYGAIPVLTLFVSFFPEVGGSLLEWLEPVRKVLP